MGDVGGKGRGRGVGNLAGGNESGAAAGLLRQLEDGRARLQAGVNGDHAVVNLDAGGDRGGSGRGIGDE
ncbi:hypothetical protein D3C83_109840 [compost metagenome]